MFNMTIAKAKMYAASADGYAPGLHAQNLAANASTNRSIFCASPGSLNPPKNKRMASSMLIDAKSNLWTYARMTTSASASGEPSNSPMAAGATRALVLRKNSAHTFGSSERAATLSVCVEGSTLKASTAFSMEAFVFFAF